jgi:hypothetical protein
MKQASVNTSILIGKSATNSELYPRTCDGFWEGLCREIGANAGTEFESKALHPEPFLLENHVRIVALMPDLQRVSFYSVTDVLHHSSTTELILSLILIKGSYPSSKASPLCRKSSLAL